MAKRFEAVKVAGGWTVRNEGTGATLDRMSEDCAKAIAARLNRGFQGVPALSITFDDLPSPTPLD
jgi:hypothetical protein